MRPEGLCQRKTPSEIEPATFQLVAQCLKQLRHCSLSPTPKYGVVTLDIIIIVCYKLCRPESTNSETRKVIIPIMICVPGLNFLPSSECNCYVVLKSSYYVILKWSYYVFLKWSYYVVLKWSYCAVLKWSYYEVLKWSC